MLTVEKNAQGWQLTYELGKNKVTARGTIPTLASEKLAAEFIPMVFDKYLGNPELVLRQTKLNTHKLCKHLDKAVADGCVVDIQTDEDNCKVYKELKPGDTIRSLAISFDNVTDRLGYCFYKDQVSDTANVRYYMNILLDPCYCISVFGRDLSDAINIFDYKVCKYMLDMMACGRVPL